MPAGHATQLMPDDENVPGWQVVHAARLLLLLVPGEHVVQAVDPAGETWLARHEKQVVAPAMLE